VYLLRVAITGVGQENPNAKIPRVELPTAEPYHDAQLAAPTPDAVDVQEE
jgi:hypothetical protein